MKAEIIFYKTKQTEINRQPLLDLFARYRIELAGLSGAFSPEQLVKRLGEAVPRSHFVWIVGGLGTEERSNTKAVLSAALHLPLYQQKASGMAGAVLNGSIPLENQAGECCGAALRQGEQVLFLLQDDPAALKDALASAEGYLQANCGLAPLELPVPAAQPLRKDDPADVRAVLEQPRPLKAGHGRSKGWWALVCALGLIAVLIFLFLVYRLYHPDFLL